LLGRLEKPLTRRAIHAARRSAEILFEELLFLDVVIELGARIA
jgi:hypothetical protein